MPLRRIHFLLHLFIWHPQRCSGPGSLLPIAICPQGRAMEGSSPSASMCFFVWLWYICHSRRKSSDLVPSTRKERHPYLPARALFHKYWLHKYLLQVFISPTFCAWHCAGRWASLKSKAAFPPKKLVEICKQWFFLAAKLIQFYHRALGDVFR